MKNKLIFIFLVSIVFQMSAQTKKFDKLLKRSLKETVPVLTVGEINSLDNYLVLDTREPKEFETSHLENSEQIGFDFFSIDSVLQKHPNKDKAILVYCSIGIRSEMIGEKLLKAGYKNVYNLYGGIFEWKNQSKMVVDKNETPTEKVHTFSKEWSKWLINGEKVYEK